MIRVRAWDEHQDRIAVAVSTDAIQTMRLEQAECGRTIQIAALKTIEVRMQRWLERECIGEPPFSAFEAARLIRIGSYLEQTARGLEPDAPARRAARRGAQRVGRRPRRREGVQRRRYGVRHLDRMIERRGGMGDLGGDFGLEGGLATAAQAALYVPTRERRERRVAQKTRYTQ